MSWFTLFACVLIHTQIFVGNWWLGLVAAYDYFVIFWSTFQGLLYLSYPVMGLLSEVFQWNFKTILVSFILMVVSSIVMLITSVVWIIGVVYSIWPAHIHFIIVVQVVVVVIGIISAGMFEANAIQFGMDQMLEASSKQLSSFIHWYFWCAHIGATVMIYLVIGVCFCGSNCKLNNIHSNTIFDDLVVFICWIALLSSCIQLPVSIIGIIACVYYKKKFPIEQASRKPLRLIYSVLKYSYNHKQPERRSALTYWENDIPSRIDLGKHKYGGPFTYEQVESVKTVIRLLLLMVSVFGFHLSGEGYSVSTYIMSTAGCPTLKVFLGFIGNPQHIAFLIALLCIPFFEILKRNYAISLQSRIWIGLFICLINEALKCLYSIILQTRSFHCPEIEIFNNHNVPLMLKCLISNVNIATLNNTCQHFCSSPPVNDTAIDLSVIIMILHGLAYVLVFSSVLEFICAQSPNETKSLLIGVWYSMLSIKSFFINILDTQVSMDTTEWNIYHGTKGVAIFVSLAAFSIVCKKYKYRERNEVVSEQAIIEEQYERELLMNTSCRKHE